MRWISLWVSHPPCVAVWQGRARILLEKAREFKVRMRLEEPGQIIIQRRPADAPGEGAADRVNQRIAVGAIVGEGDQSVPGLDFRRISRLAALNRLGAARQRP